MTRWTMNIWAGGLQSVAVFTRSHDSSASLPRKVRGMTRKAAEVRIVFWDMGEEATNRGRVVGPQRHLALGEQSLTRS